MNASRKAIISAIALILSLIQLSAKAVMPASMASPDFSMPETVSADAMKSLNKGIKNHDNNLIIKSLIDYTISNTIKDESRMGHCISVIDSVIGLSTDPSLKAILECLEAKLYDDVYLSRRYVYDSRELPLTPRDPDITKWSGEQFRQCIFEHVQRSLSDREALISTPLRDYLPVLDCDRSSVVYFPTLYDFLAYKSIDLLTDVNHWQSIFSGGLLVPFNVYAVMRFNQQSVIAKYILELYASLISLHINDTPALIYADLKRISFVSDHLYDSSDDNVTVALKNLYTTFRTSEYSGDILMDILNRAYYYGSRRNSDGDFTQWCYDAIKWNLKEFPGFHGNDCLQNRLDILLQKNINIEFDSPLVAPGKPLWFTVKSTNAGNVELQVIRIDTLRLDTSDIEKIKAIDTLNIAFAGEAPFCASRRMNYTFDVPGYYMFVPVIEGERRCDGTDIHVTNLAVASLTDADNAMIYAMDITDGAPVSGADVIRRVSSSRWAPVGKTDSEGAMNITSDNYGSNFYATKGDDRYCFDIFARTEPDKMDKKLIVRAAAFTALSVYRPGDEINWTAVIYGQNNTSQEPECGFEVKAMLKNPNYEIVDSVTLLTDDWGRVEAKFTTPNGDLTGIYYIELFDTTGKSLTQRPVMVSDYKMPSFKIGSVTAETNVPGTGCVTVTGNVVSYSGFRMARSRVKISLEVSAPIFYDFRFSASGTEFYSTETETDGNGDFSVAFGADVFEQSPCPDGIYIAKISVTSETGESHEASTVFTLHPRFTIKVENLSDYLNPVNATEPFKVNASAYSVKGERTDTPLCYSLYDKSVGFIMEGPLPSDGVIPLDTVPSGSYDFKITPKDKSVAEPFKASLVVYRPDDKKSPVPMLYIWSTQNKMDLGNDRKLSWLFAANCDSRLLVDISTCRKSIFRKWIEVKEGMNRFNYILPDSVISAELTAIGYGNGNSGRESLDITTPELRAKQLFIKAESFRDKINPSGVETWSFSVVNAEGKAQESAVMLDMYNSALDAIQKFRWNFNPKPYYNNSPNISIRNNYYFNKNAYSYPSIPYKSCSGIAEPDFDFYGYSLFASQSVMMMKLSAGANVVREHREEVIVESAMDDAGGVAVLGYGSSKSADDVKFDKATDSAAFEYRDSEVALAMFRPMLHTDSDGRLTFSFDVPNANATWNFLAMAYNREVSTAYFNASVIASKPVMVKPNLPRFVRLGDKVEVQAMVMNNSDKQLSIHTTIEIFDPATGEILGSRESDCDVNAGESTLAEITMDASREIPMMGYRIKSSTADFADGEQSVIPVLPAVTPVIESRTFYLAPDSLTFSMTLPAAPADARLTLQFCENPAWYVVTALPGLLQNSASTANEAAASIFSAAVARGLLNDNPEIEKALKAWTESDRSDSTLVSMLERNSDLKIMLLNATPWMMDSRSETERMARLSVLFDRTEIDRVMASSVDLLSRLEAPSGGWKWIGADARVSQWSTMNVLLMMGRLNRSGYLPKNSVLKSMIIRAIGFTDSVAAADFRKFPKDDYRLFTFMRSLFPSEEMSTDAKAVATSTVNSVLRNWKKHNVFDKAVDAMILHRYGYPSMSRNIIESLRQFSSFSPQKGMWWPALDNMTCWSMGKVGTTSMILDAFHEVTPESADVDRIRQWLILQKEANDWGTSVTATEVINSILASSRRWLKPAAGVNVTIGDTSVTPSDVEKITGYFRQSITGVARDGGELRITRVSESPAWGAVFSQFTSDMANVEEMPSDGIRISKRLLKYTSDGVKDAGEITTGDKIRVELTIENERDMDYVAIIDDRPACFEPVEQLPKPIFSEGCYFYRENRDSSTRIFISHLPKGTYLLTYDMWVNNSGDYTSGIATIQSQYAPQLTAHSAGTVIHVMSKRPHLSVKP